MFILGLTGSIGMGKTFAAGGFRRLGVPVHDSDAAVHALMVRGGAAVEAVGASFPGVVTDGAVDRKKLGAKVFGDKAALRRLEAILHPLVRAQETAFLKFHARLRSPLVVLDIPLLFETGGERRCDAVCVVSAPARIQRARVLARPGMTEERLGEIQKHQISDYKKRRAADFVVNSGLGPSYALRQITRIATIAGSHTGRHWPPFPMRRG